MAADTNRVDNQVLKWIGAALALQQAGENESALDMLLRARAQAPEYAPIHLLMGLSYRDIGRFQEAEASLRRAVQLDPKRADAIQSLGLFLSSQGRSAEAVRWFKRHIELEPDDPITLKALVTELLRLGRHKEAAPFLREAWEKTKDEETGITYGRYLIRVGQVEEAEAVLRKVAERHPQPRPLVEWAYTLVLLSQPEAALPVLYQILEIDPGFDRAWRGISGCYLALRDYDKALEAAQEALAIDDCHYRNWLAKANALMHLHQHTKLLEAARAGLACTPADAAEALPVYQELRLREVEGLLETGQVEEGLARLDQLCVEFPAEGRFTCFYVSVLNGLGRAEDALRAVDRAHEAGQALDGNLAPLRYEALHILGRSAEAKAFVEPMLAQQRDSRLDTLASIGVSLYERGRIDASRAIFDQLCELAPDASRFANNYAFILVGEGELKRAEECYTRALEMEDSGEWQPLILVNLGYVHLLRGDYDQADECLRQGTSLASAEAEAILRVAYWRGDQVQPDDLAHPRQAMPLRASAQANLATLALARGRAQEAEALARQMIEETPEAPWGYRMMGWILRTKGDIDEARRTWEQALNCAQTPEERQVVAQWIDALPNYLRG